MMKKMKKGHKTDWIYICPKLVDPLSLPDWQVGKLDESNTEI